MMTIGFIHERDTKNFSVYVEESRQGETDYRERSINRLYLPKGLPNRITATLDETERSK